MKILRLAAAAATAAAVPSPASACASCGCTLAADWLSQGLVTTPGTTLLLRYDYVPQTVLRSGSHRVDRSAIALPSDREIERRTDNHYLTAAIDHQFASDWGVNLQLPFNYRPHATVAEGDTDESRSRTGGIGDARLTARWQGLSTPGNITGLQFGVQLPTGRIHQQFRSGPQAGEDVDRGLQPGFGVTQLVAGAYRTGTIGGGFDYIVQAQGLVPLYRRDAYRPGTSGEASAGAQYGGWRGITPQFQMNLRVAERDRGENSDVENSGGTILAATPGLIARVSRTASAFAYAQLPVWSHVRGYQLQPRATASVGLQLRL